MPNDVTAEMASLATKQSFVIYDEIGISPACDDNYQKSTDELALLLDVRH